MPEFALTRSIQEKISRSADGERPDDVADLVVAGGPHAAFAELGRRHGEPTAAVGLIRADDAEPLDDGLAPARHLGNARDELGELGDVNRLHFVFFL